MAMISTDHILIIVVVLISSIHFIKSSPSLDRFLFDTGVKNFNHQYIDEVLPNRYNLYLLQTDNNAQLWDFDYLQELFRPPQFHILNGSRFRENYNDIEPPTVIQCSEKRHADEISNFKVNTLYRNATFKILYHNCDEFMGENLNTQACDAVYHQFNLVLRTYQYFGSKDTSNIMIIPQGYMVGMLRDEIGVPQLDLNTSLSQNNDSHIHHHHSPREMLHSSLEFAYFSLSKSAAQRENNWSFFGGMHGRGRNDREDMIRTFTSWHPYMHGHSLEARQMRHNYNNTKFVPIGRGWVTLDCQRIYEAIICGAIPVLKGSPSEIARTFRFESGMPPLITAGSWDEALKICQNMTNEDIDVRRRELYDWYVNIRKQMQKRIAAALLA